MQIEDPTSVEAIRLLQLLRKGIYHCVTRRIYRGNSGIMLEQLGKTKGYVKAIHN